MIEHPAAWDIERLLGECESRRQRRSGPGGQHRNKVETAVVMTHTPTSVRGEASERRSQEQNRRVALFRLRVNLALQVRSPVDSGPRRPSDLWRSRCRDGRIGVRATHHEFPALLAEAMDVLQALEMDVKPAAAWLNCTTSQLTRFLKLEPRALAEVNRNRQAKGLRPLH